MSDENGVPSGGLATTTTTVAATPTATTSAALAIPTFSSMAEADAWATAHNTTIWEAMGQPNAQEVGEANEWMSFVLMSCGESSFLLHFVPATRRLASRSLTSHSFGFAGWFILLTSLGGYWRVKRFGSFPFLPRSSSRLALPTHLTSLSLFSLPERSLLISQQTDASPSTTTTDAEPSTSSVNPTRSWFTPPGASSSNSNTEGDDQPITTARGGPNAFQSMGQSIRGFTAGVRERMEVMRGSGNGGRGGRRREDQEEEELMLE